MVSEERKERELCEFLSDNLRDGDLVKIEPEGGPHNPDQLVAGRVLQVIGKPIRGSVAIAHYRGIILTKSLADNWLVDYNKHNGKTFFTIGLRYIAATTRPMK